MEQVLIISATLGATLSIRSLLPAVTADRDAHEGECSLSVESGSMPDSIWPHAIFELRPSLDQIEGLRS